MQFPIWPLCKYYLSVEEFGYQYILKVFYFGIQFLCSCGLISEGNRHHYYSSITQKHCLCANIEHEHMFHSNVLHCTRILIKISSKIINKRILQSCGDCDMLIWWYTYSTCEQPMVI